VGQILTRNNKLNLHMRGPTSVCSNESSTYYNATASIFLLPGTNCGNDPTKISEKVAFGTVQRGAYFLISICRRLPSSLPFPEFIPAPEIYTCDLISIHLILSHSSMRICNEYRVRTRGSILIGIRSSNLTMVFRDFKI
jgi:hypothetical protein